jgi:putative protease
MIRPNHPLELLAPARNADFGIEAIKHGADAVYIGGPAFGARYGASNDVAEIRRLCAFAHRYRTKVFVALNTILRDDELEESRQLAWQLYDAGADALIVQDMGLLELELPPIQLHASTQTDNRHADKVRFLQDVGFSQVVLARKLSFNEIINTSSQTTVALEYFFHGALCVAYSGQCYISQAHTGRSANRGECSQACRLPYTLIDDKGKTITENQHLLSMKDNNQTENMLAAGIVADFLRVAVLTAQHMAAQRRGTALLNGRHDLELPQTQVAHLRLPPRRTVGAEDIRHLQACASHGTPMRCSSAPAD